MITDAQAKLLRRKRMDGKTQEAAAAAADMSERSARKWECRAPCSVRSARSRLTFTPVSCASPISSARERMPVGGPALPLGGCHRAWRRQFSHRLCGRSVASGFGASIRRPSPPSSARQAGK